MSSHTDANSDIQHDLREQFRVLHEKLDALLNAKPALKEAREGIAEAIRAGCGVTSEQIDALSGRVRERPISAVLLAAGAGFIVGRLLP